MCARVISTSVTAFSNCNFTLRWISIRSVGIRQIENVNLEKSKAHKTHYSCIITPFDVVAVNYNFFPSIHHMNCAIALIWQARIDRKRTEKSAHILQRLYIDLYVPAPCIWKMCMENRAQRKIFENKSLNCTICAERRVHCEKLWMPIGFWESQHSVDFVCCLFLCGKTLKLPIRRRCSEGKSKKRIITCQ